MYPEIAQKKVLKQIFEGYYLEKSMHEEIPVDENYDSVEVLRKRLNGMKRIMSENTNNDEANKYNTEEIWATKPRSTVGMIDTNFLSIAFATALLVIVSVSIYAFYSLYHAVLKKFPSHHTEL